MVEFLVRPIIGAIASALFFLSGCVSGKEVVDQEKTDYGAVALSRNVIGDLDCDGTMEAILISEKEKPVSERKVYVLDFELNGSIIFSKEYEHMFRLGDTFASLDIDSDGVDEIVFTTKPMVDYSCTLFSVIKPTETGWVELETLGDESELRNGFPIQISWDDKVSKLAIEVDGYSGVIEYAGYKVLKVQEKGNEPWGYTPQLCDVKYHYMSGDCLAAEQVVYGRDRFDVIGDLWTYFNYDKEGKIKVLKLVFRPSTLEIESKGE